MTHLFFFLLLPLLLVKCDLLTIPLIKNKFNMYIVSPCIGSEKSICDEFNLDLTKETIVAFGNSNYKPQKSSTSQQISQTDSSRTYTDNFSFKHNPSLEFHNITIEHRISSYKNLNGYFGLGSNPNNPHSLLNTLFTSLNSHKIFYINTRQLEIGIGEYPNEINEIKTKESVLYRTCHMIKDSNTQYACNANSAYFKSVAKNDYVFYEINNKIKFCPTKNAIFTTDSFANVIYKNYLIEQIKEGSCEEVHSDSSGFKYVWCKHTYDYKNDERLTDITFVLGKFSFRLFRHELFALGTDNKLYFLIVNNPEGNGWFFGYTFFNKFLTVFDIETDTVGFIPFDKE